MAAFFYDKQIRRFLIQFAKIFSNWQVVKGVDQAGNDILVRVPVQYSDVSRQGLAALNNNSASSMNSAPMITYYINGLEYDQKRTQDPYFVDVKTIRQRKYNSITGEYEQAQGDAFTLERIMPVPYTLRISVDIWTSNTEQKLQLIEQLGVLFNPSLEIQSSDNYFDWTSLSVVYQDGITYTSRSIPQGNGNNIDIMSWKFYMPIWISSPAKLKKLGIIHKIVASIFDGNTFSDMQDDDLLLGTRQKITPYGYKILLLGDSLQLIPQQMPTAESLDLPSQNNSNVDWRQVLIEYGVVRPGISQIWIENPHTGSEIVGTIDFDDADERLLTYTIDTDTLPQNTLTAINMIIDPMVKWPGHGLPAPVTGQRYLILSDMGENPVWGNILANVNDVIQYNGSAWSVAFDSVAATSAQYVTNLTSGVQYRYYNSEWTKAWEGYYPEGSYSIVL